MSQSDEQAKPWYQNGLRFECTQCGDCCSGSPGFVWVTLSEMKAIADLLGIEDEEEFEELYTKRKGVRRSLKEFPNGDCVFLDETTRGCTIYAARPKQCRTWPFWNSNVRDEKAWEATCQECPGSGKGKLYSLEQIEERRKAMRI